MAWPTRGDPRPTSSRAVAVQVPARSRWRRMGGLVPREAGYRAPTCDDTEGEMAELTKLEDKLGEVLGLANAAKEATSKVAGLGDDDGIAAPAGRGGGGEP